MNKKLALPKLLKFQTASFIPLNVLLVAIESYLQSIPLNFLCLALPNRLTFNTFYKTLDSEMLNNTYQLSCYR